MKTSLKFFFIGVLIMYASGLQGQHVNMPYYHERYNVVFTGCDSQVIVTSDGHGGFKTNYSSTYLSPYALIEHEFGYDEDKKLAAYKTVTRDEKKRIIQLDNINISGKLWQRQLFSYDNDGRMIHAIFKDSSLNILYRQSYFYDSNGKYDSVVWESKNGNDWIPYRSEAYTVNSSGYIIRMRVYFDPTAQQNPLILVSEYIYTYDQNNHLKEVIQEGRSTNGWTKFEKSSYSYKINGELNAKTIYHYKDSLWEYNRIDSFDAPGTYTSWVYRSGSWDFYRSETCHPRSTVGLEMPMDEQKVNVYPNPAQNQLNFSSTEELLNGHITVYDISGRELLNDRVKTLQQQLDVSTLKAGTYFLRINSASGDKVEHVKFMKK